MIAALLIAFLLGGATPAPSPAPTPAPSPVPTVMPTSAPSPTPKVSATPHALKVLADAAHDGSDEAHAIVITAPDGRSGVYAEFGYLYKQTCGAKTGRWLVQKQSTIETSTNIYDQLDTECSDGSSTKTFFFDITDFFGKN